MTPEQGLTPVATSAAGTTAHAATRRDVVIVALRDPQDRVLMVRTRRFPGHWQPVGGGMEHTDTDPVQAVCRELHEETGLLLECADFRYVTELPYDFGDGTVFCYEAAFDPSCAQPQFDEDEVLAHKWVPVGEAATLEMFPATATFMGVLRAAGMNLADISVVTICSSSKFYATAKHVASELRRRGLVVYTPRFDFDEELVQVGPEDKAELTREFLTKIAKSDAIYVVNEQGYTGTSVCIEVGYASALGKAVILSEPAVETAVTALANRVIDVETLLSVWRVTRTRDDRTMEGGQPE